jgi:uncharacterized membrane protein YqjE
MADTDSGAPSLPELLRKLVATGLAALRNRGELFLVELQEEKTRVIELCIWVCALCFLGMMFLVVLTGIVIFVFPENKRIYVAAGFCGLYLLGAILAWLNLRALWKNSPLPFSDTLAEAKKDNEWFESSE